MTRELQIENLDTSIFEIKDGEINLTKIAQSQGKKINDWLRLKNTKEYLDHFLAKNSSSQNPVVLKIGTFGAEGYFTKEKVIAYELCRWISPGFALWANEKIEELLDKGSVSLQTKVPTNYLEALQEAVRLEGERLALEKKIQEQEPLVNFATTIMQAETSIPLSEYWKVANIKNTFNLNLKEFWAWLRDNDILYYRNIGNRSYNCAYQNLIDKGFFEVVEDTYQDQTKRLKIQTLITPKGQVWLMDKLKKQLQETLIDYGYVLPYKD